MRTFSSVYAFNPGRFGLRRATYATNGAESGGGDERETAKSKELCVSIANIISDYRPKMDIPPRTSEDVKKWVDQFDQLDRLPILEEMAHILERMYFSEARVRKFIRHNVVSCPKLTGGNPAAFWRNTEVLCLQHENSNSQRDMLKLFDEELRATCGYGREECKGDGKNFVYLDDGIFSGNQAVKDIANWLKNNEQAADFTLHIVVIGLHDGGQSWICKRLKQLSLPWEKIEFKALTTIPCWRKKGNKPDKSGVLWPCRWPDDDPAVKKWLLRAPADHKWLLKVQEHHDKYDVLRPKGQNPDFFKSESGRDILEQAFLRKGADLYCRPTTRTESFRPLGAQALTGWGFGSLFVTYRNCPNNCPLVWWDTSDGWLPLFPRRHRKKG